MRKFFLDTLSGLIICGVCVGFGVWWNSTHHPFTQEHFNAWVQRNAEHNEKVDKDLKELLKVARKF